MSVKWMSLMWESELKGPELLLALAIADHADSDGRCFPGIGNLALKTKLTKRQTQRIVQQLESKNVIAIERGKGRGNKTIFQFQKVVEMSPFTEAEKVTEASPFTDTEKVTFSAIKGDILGKEKVTFSVPAPYIESSVESSRKKKGNSTASKKSLNPETKKTRPDLEDEAWLIHLRQLPENRGIDVAGLYARMLEWCEQKRVTPSRLRLLNWLGREREAMPVSYRPPATNGSKPFDPGRNSEPIDQVIAPPIPEPLPQRPAASVPIEQTHAWNAFRDAIAEQIAPDIFRTWFKPLIFDGIDAKNSAFRVRTRQITHEWVTSYYSETLYNAFGTIGMPEFSIKWEIEPEIYEEIATA